MPRPSVGWTSTARAWSRLRRKRASHETTLPCAFIAPARPCGGNSPGAAAPARPTVASIASAPGLRDSEIEAVLASALPQLLERRLHVHARHLFSPGEIEVGVVQRLRGAVPPLPRRPPPLPP